MVVLDPTSVNYNPSATDDNGTCLYEGNVTFWYNSNGSSATVTVGGKQDTLLNIIRHTTQVAVQLVVLIYFTNWLIFLFCIFNLEYMERYRDSDKKWLFINVITINSENNRQRTENKNHAHNKV